MRVDLESFTYTNDSRFSSTIEGRPMNLPREALVSNRYTPKDDIEVNPNSINYVYPDNNTESAIYNTEAKAFPAITLRANIKSTASYFFTYFKSGHPYWINGQ